MERGFTFPERPSPSPLESNRFFRFVVTGGKNLGATDFQNEDEVIYPQLPSTSMENVFPGWRFTAYIRMVTVRGKRV